VILLIVLLTLGYSSQFDFASFVELGDLKSDPYGKSLIETISMSLEKSPGGKIENIQALLKDLLNKLNDEQIASDKKWAETKKRLNALILKLGVKIAKLEGEIAKLKQHLVWNLKKKAQSIKNIAQYKKQKTADINTLNQLKLKRRADHASYDISMKDHSAIIAAIDQVVASLLKLKGSIAGVAKPSFVKSIAAERRDQAALKAKFVEIFDDDAEAQIFVELATEADQAALDRLIALLNNIKRNVQKSMNDDERHEAKSKTIYKKLKLSLSNDVTVLKTTIKKQKARLDKYVKNINEINLKLDVRQKLLKSRQTELANAKKEYINKENTYIAERKQRKREMKVIRKVQTIVEDRLATMKKFLRSKVNQ